MAIWTGVPLKDILQRAGIQDKAVDVQLIGLDVESRDILDIVEGHTGQGYGIARDEDYSKFAMHMYKIVFIDSS